MIKVFPSSMRMLEAVVVSENCNVSPDQGRKGPLTLGDAALGSHCLPLKEEDDDLIESSLGLAGCSRVISSAAVLL